MTRPTAGCGCTGMTIATGALNAALETQNAHQGRYRGRPAAKTEACLPLRPPDLIIQDELHLIAGPLGSLFGLYETAVDALCSWTVEGRPARPKIVASTATVRRAEHQTYNLFCRQLAVFPPQVLDAGDYTVDLNQCKTVTYPDTTGMVTNEGVRRMFACMESKGWSKVAN